LNKIPKYLRDPQRVFSKQYKSFIPNNNIRRRTKVPFHNINDIKVPELKLFTKQNKPFPKDYPEYAPGKKKMSYTKGKPLMSKLDKYITNLSAHRKKPMYYQLQQLIRRRAVAAYNATGCNYYPYPKRTRLEASHQVYPKNIKEKKLKTVNVEEYNPHKNLHGVVIDWSKSPLYKEVKDETLGYNSNKLKGSYHDFELDHVKNQLIKDSKLVHTIHTKALNTFNKLIKELALEHLFNSLNTDYSKAEYEEVIECLDVCKELFAAKKDLIHIFIYINKREVSIKNN